MSLSVQHDTKRNTDIICKNCGTNGHIYRDCPYPIKSFGVICYKYVNNKIYYIMIQRKNSLAFMEFIKGNYKSNDLDTVKWLINSMTKDEQSLLHVKTFDSIWETIWLQSNNKNTKEYTDAKTNFDSLQRSNTLHTILDTTTEYIEESEWGFPKGRKKQHENDIDCAMREFTEETQFDIKKVEFLKIEPFSEIFYGTNNVLYCHTYYIAELTTNMNIPEFNTSCIQQVREIRDIQWMTYNDVIKHINKHNTERLELFKKVNNTILQYKI